MPVVEAQMGEETGKSDSLHLVLPPLFPLRQTALEEIDHHGERWLEYSASQVAESFCVAAACARSCWAPPPVAG